MKTYEIICFHIKHATAETSIVDDKPIHKELGLIVIFGFSLSTLISDARMKPTPMPKNIPAATSPKMNPNPIPMNINPINTSPLQ